MNYQVWENEKGEGGVGEGRGSRILTWQAQDTGPWNVGTARSSVL